jgi:hypothetical protein
MPKQIPLSGKCGAGRFTVVDDEDYVRLAAHRWRICNGYAARSVWDGRKNTVVYMHREVLGVPHGLFTDHINGNRLDNRAANLRICTQAENNRNSRAYGRTSRFKGVCKHIVNHPYGTYQYWRAKIATGGRTRDIGYYPYTAEGEIAAALAYDAAAREHFGEFAYLNYPSADDTPPGSMIQAGGAAAEVLESVDLPLGGVAAVVRHGSERRSLIRTHGEAWQSHPPE